MAYRRIAQLRSIEQLQAYLKQIGADLPLAASVTSGPDAPLAQPYAQHGYTIGNRFCVLPMEGWDGTRDGRPSDLTRRRWQRFGQSGAKLIWGGEAVAVRFDGRASPNQVLLTDDTAAEIAALRAGLVASHEENFGTSDDLLIGLQLTHSGRFSRPNDKSKLEPRTAYAHPLLDEKFSIDPDKAVMSDAELDELAAAFIKAAVLAQQAGFDFVDIKHCHGYLAHELLSAVQRPGPYGGSLHNRLKFLREIVTGIRTNVPDLQVGVRLSAFDWIPFEENEQGLGEAASSPQVPYPFAFGGDGSGTGIDLSEPKALLDALAEMDIHLVCITGGSPYYVPHIQRPALFPPSDGYQPPEDPLCGVARQIQVTAELKHHRPDLCIVGSGYSYLQEWLPHVGQAVIEGGMADFIGLGRMMLTYPEMPADVLNGAALQRKRICRTFSDCTTAPRQGMPSGCYPLDDFYKQRDEYAQLLDIKKSLKQ